MFDNKRMAKVYVVFICNGILFGHEEEGLWGITDVIQGHDAKWDKSE